MSVSEPTWLLALVLVLLLAAVELRVHRQRLPVLSRAGVLSILVLALARPVVRLPAPGETVIFVVDRSASLSEEAIEAALAEVDARRAALGADDEAGLVLFDGRAEVEVLPGAPWTVGAVSPAGDATDIGGALRAAASLVPADGPGRIVLLTDGRATTGSIAPPGLPLEVIPVAPGRAGPELAAVTLRQESVTPGETVSGEVLVHGPADGEVVLTLGETRLTTLPVRIEAGATEVLPFEAPLPDTASPGFSVVEATLGEGRARAGIVVEDPVRVWIVHRDRQDARPLADLLEAEHLEVRLLRVAELRDRPLDEVDLVVLIDVPAEAGEAAPVPPDLLARLGPWVEAGGGLITVGGQAAYDLGGWHRSPLADLLPVRMEPEGRAREPEVALVVVLDKSGSMAEAAQGGEIMDQAMRRLVGGRAEGSKIRLVGEAAAAALHALRPFDRVGVLAVDSTARWAAPLQSATEAADVAAMLRGMEAGGGGLAVLPALEAAFETLRDDPAPLRHVVLFADASDTEGRRSASQTAIGLAGEVADEGVTLTVIGVGHEQSRDTPFLRALAEAGAGRFLLADGFGDLRALFVAETERLVHQSLEEEPVVPRLDRWHPAIRGVDLAGAPPLRGHHAVARRLHATVVLQAPDGAPILATWRVGLGEVAAVTTDAGGRWAADWVRWPGHARLWTQLARHLARPTAAGAASIRLTAADGTLKVGILRRAHDGTSLEEPPPSGEIVREGRTAPLPLALAEPGLWEGTIDAAPGEELTVRARDAAGTLVAERRVVAPPSGERRFLTADVGALEQLSAPAAEVERTRALLPGPWLLALALLLLPVDAGVRRRLRAR